MNRTFEIKKKIVLAGESKIFEDWKRKAGISVDAFLAGLEWLCDDPLDEQGRLTRQLGCTRKGEIVKVQRVQMRNMITVFYRLDNGEFFGGDVASISMLDKI